MDSFFLGRHGSYGLVKYIMVFETIRRLCVAAVWVLFYFLSKAVFDEYKGLQKIGFEPNFWKMIGGIILYAVACYGIYRGVNWIFQKDEKED